MKAKKVENDGKLNLLHFTAINKAERIQIKKSAQKSIAKMCKMFTPQIPPNSLLAEQWRKNYEKKAMLKKAAKKAFMNEYAFAPVDWSRIDYDAFAKSRIRGKGNFTYATIAYLQQKGESHIGDIVHGIGLASYCKAVSEYEDRAQYYWLSCVWPRLLKLGIIVRTKRGYYKINEREYNIYKKMGNI